jgi:hypothetical protein
MTVFAPNPLDCLNLDKVEADKTVWREVFRFLVHYTSTLRGKSSRTKDIYSVSAKYTGILCKDIEDHIGVRITAKQYGEAFHRAGIQVLKTRTQYSAGQRRRRNFWNIWELVAVCNWLCEVGAEVGASSNPSSITLDFKPFVSAVYSRTVQKNDPPCRAVIHKPSTSLDSSVHLSSTSIPSTGNIIDLQAYKSSAGKDVFHSSLPSLEDDFWFYDQHFFCEDGAYLAYVRLAHRLIDYASYNSSNHCLELAYNQNKDGYAEWTSSLFTKLAEGVDLVEKDLPCRSISRFMAIVAYPERNWEVTAGREGRVLEDGDVVAHHKCRNPSCIRPDHLQPLEQIVHRELHRYSHDDHPCLAPSSYVNDNDLSDDFESHRDIIL